MNLPRVLCLFCVLGGGLLSSVGCRRDMQDQPKIKAYRRTDFFGDERSARPLVAGTVARGQLEEESLLAAARSGAAFSDALPLPVDEALLRRGQERYTIYCSPCHGRLGRGDGMVVRRGYRQPSSFHVERLRAQPAGYFFDAISHGFGAMPDYAQIPVRDRWAIVAYVRVLQMSQNVPVSELTPEARAQLDKEAATP